MTMSLQKAVWEGSVPTRIRLGDQTLYLSLARISYLPLYLPTILPYFGLNVAEDDAWFAFQSVPVKW